MITKYLVLQRQVKYPRIEIKDFAIRIILPKNSQIEPKELLKQKEDWLRKKIEFLEELKKKASELHLKENKNYQEMVYFYVQDFAKKLGVYPKKILFRKMKRSWATCNYKNEITFNKAIRFLPSDLIKYIVCHEMVHLLIKNHKKEFWILVKAFFKDFAEYEKQLSVYKILINSKD